ncbi:hypothetical protein BOX15_Mlig019617g10 [Macrostomum lignano]|uniref:RNA-directed DNA polymerase n=1 Tax=Macrostomum lignano TaxID=282301 RepID=A0A267FVG7_9PLAT|nr:hypothetical protein BOX15_Mlig019617g10 [Macrostomum lignano]
MASQAASELPLNDPAMAEAWLQSFEALCRHKKLQDTNEEKQVTDLFLARAGINAVRSVSIMAKPKNIEDMTFKDIKKMIIGRLQPKKKLVIAERTRFMSQRQLSTESAQQFAERLRDAAKHCEFDKLNEKDCKQSAEDDLIQTLLISGLCDHSQRTKTLEHIQSSENPVTLDTCLQYIQQLELIQSYSSSDRSAEAREPSRSSETAESSTPVASIDRNRNSGAQCRSCGLQHQPGKCPAFGKTCNKCHRRNHFAAVCRSSAKSKSVAPAHEIDTSECEQAGIYTIVGNESGSGSIKTVLIEGKPFKMQLDSGSGASIIPINFWRSLGEPKLRKSKLRLRQFDGTVIRTRGCFTALIEVGRQIACADVTVTECTKEHGLIGTDVLDFKLDTATVNQVERSSKPLGKLKGFRARVLLRENAQPSFFDARPLPIHLKPLVVAKLRTMIDAGILEPVPPGGSSWASPIVVVRKADGDLRICSDYKVGVNPKICSDAYPLPNIEQAFSALAGMKHFAIVDLTNAYNQIELDEASREILTINTPLGLLRWTRMPYGVKTASAQFQAAMEATVGGAVSNLVIYQDDMCVGATTADELDSKVRDLLRALSDAGMSINEKKCVFRSTEISFLGYCIAADGVRPDRKLVEKILGVSTPASKKELESFLGMTVYYSRYIKSYSEKTEPLTELRSKKVAFHWGPRQQKAFDELKQALAASPVVRIFDARKRTTLTTDASEKAIAAILSQDEHPVMYLSRRLTPAERNYSNIEREALAVVWATQRARHFLLGSKFVLQCDHQPLEFIFSPSRELPKVTSARIMRWALQLSAFDYEISYIKGSCIPHVDALSRIEFKEGDGDDCQESFVHWTETEVLKLEQIRDATDNDPVLASVKRRIRSNAWNNCSAAERPYKAVRQQLSVENGVVCLRDLVVPPSRLRQDVLRAAHGDSHCGALATRNRLKLEAWWPGHCEDVENFVKQCQRCAEIRPMPARTCHTWPAEDGPWRRVHMDHAHVPGFGLLLIVVDAFSGWPEAVPVADKSATTVIKVLRLIFSRLGVPHTLVADNAPEFRDQQLHEWLKKIGCSPMHSPPYHPQSNGCAERMVQTVKKGLRAFAVHQGRFDAYLAKLLLNYRATPRGDGRGSPSALMGRQLRSPLTLQFDTDAPLVYQSRPGGPAETVRFVVQAGHNTAVVTRDKDDRPVLAHRDQLRLRPSPSRAEVTDNTDDSGRDPDDAGRSPDDGDRNPDEGGRNPDEGGRNPEPDSQRPDAAAPPQQAAEATPEPRRSCRSTKGVAPDRLSPRW